MKHRTPSLRKQRVAALFAFIQERQSIYLRRQSGELKPWTTNVILRQYRFTNVYRNQDKVTRWIHTNWLHPHKDDSNIWFAMCMARLLNLPTSLEAISYPNPWKENKFIKTLHRLQEQRQKVFNPAYIVSTNGHAMDKVEYIAECVLTPLWLKRKQVWAVINNETLGTVPPTKLADVHNCLTQFNGLGSFLAAQVIADLKEINPLKNAVDWHIWAASGPGSRRGLNRVCGRDPKERWREEEWLNILRELHIQIIPKTKKLGWNSLHCQDLQNCLCEFDKYERTRLGEGRPKQRYSGI